MEYPIFNSIVNRIDSDLSKRISNVVRFRSWDEQAINATGLEIIIDLKQRTRYLKKATINFDWDKFREARLARQLEGVEKHPLLKEKHLEKSSIEPLIDVEVIWHFNEQAILNGELPIKGNQRTAIASEWMANINRELNNHLHHDDVITRWHVEVEGDLEGKYISDMSLISYQQFSLQQHNTLNDIHQMVTRNIQRILIRTNKIIRIADFAFPVAA